MSLNAQVQVRVAVLHAFLECLNIGRPHSRYVATPRRPVLHLARGQVEVINGRPWL